MSIQNKYDLSLIGHLIVDEIYCISDSLKEGTSNKYNSYNISIGGIGNIIEALNNDELKIFVETIVNNDINGKLIKQFLENKNIDYYLHKPNINSNLTSKAIILSSLKSKERTSFVNWGCGLEDFNSKNKKAKWSHFSYLDIIPHFNLEGIRNNSNIVSADLCLSSHSDKEKNELFNQMQYLDYLFISETEFSSLTDNNLYLLTSKYKLGCLVLHKRDKTFIVKEDKSKEVINNIEPIDNINVLGAGDAYCANFILYQLYNYPDEIKAANYAHKQATNFILSKSKKNEEI